jgi:hypothetical protein
VTLHSGRSTLPSGSAPVHGDVVAMASRPTPSGEGPRQDVLTSRRPTGPEPDAPVRSAAPGGQHDGAAHATAAAVARLSAEFPARRVAVVSRTVDECRRDLDGAPPGALPELLERLARQRLQDGVPRRPPPRDPTRPGPSAALTGGGERSRRPGGRRTTGPSATEV